jgi:uncharacterized membrane protein YbhN (UPF0104 family)
MKLLRNLLYGLFSHCFSIFIALLAASLCLAVILIAIIEETWPGFLTRPFLVCLAILIAEALRLFPPPIVEQLWAKIRERRRQRKQKTLTYSDDVSP